MTKSETITQNSKAVYDTTQLVAEAIQDDVEILDIGKYIGIISFKKDGIKYTCSIRLNND
jgi:hypothetical protein